VIASVSLTSETARIVREAGGGWVTDSADPTAFAAKAVEILRDPRVLQKAGRAGYAYAQGHFTPARVAEQFEGVLESAVTGAVSR
jgi:glycosyltransferase involved in cell wall biosynthesis